MSEIDLLDGLDHAVDFERRAFEEGEIEGMQDAESMIEEGYHFGLTKGFLFWSEIGYICDMVKSLREEYAQNSRLVRKCDDIIHRIEQIPETNCDQFDFVSELEVLRGKYKSIGPMALPFLPAEPQATTSW